MQWHIHWQVFWLDAATRQQQEDGAVLREDKGRKSAELIKNSLEDVLEIDQVHKMISDNTRDSRIFREIGVRFGKRQTREGVT